MSHRPSSTGYSECTGVVHNGKCFKYFLTARFFTSGGMLACQEWGGVYAPLRDWSDRAVISRLMNRNLAAAVGGAGNPWVGLERRGTTASAVDFS